MTDYGIPGWDGYPPKPTPCSVCGELCKGMECSDECRESSAKLRRVGAYTTARGKCRNCGGPTGFDAFTLFGGHCSWKCLVVALSRQGNDCHDGGADDEPGWHYSKRTRDDGSVTWRPTGTKY